MSIATESISPAGPDERCFVSFCSFCRLLCTTNICRLQCKHRWSPRACESAVAPCSTFTAHNDGLLLINSGLENNSRSQPTWCLPLRWGLYCKIETHVRSISIVGMEFWRLMVSTASMHVRSFACASCIVFNAGGCISLLWLYIALLIRPLQKVPSSKHLASASLISWAPSIMSNGSSSVRLILSVPSVLSVNHASRSSCLILVWWATPKSYLSSRNRNFSISPKTLAQASNHFMVSCWGRTKMRLGPDVFVVPILLILPPEVLRRRLSGSAQHRWAFVTDISLVRRYRFLWL